MHTLLPEKATIDIQQTQAIDEAKNQQKETLTDSDNRESSSTISPIVEYVYRFKKSCKRNDTHARLAELKDNNYSSSCKVFLPNQQTFVDQHKSFKGKFSSDKKRSKSNKRNKYPNDYSVGLPSVFDLTSSQYNSNTIRENGCQSAGADYKWPGNRKSRYDLTMERERKFHRRWASVHPNDWMNYDNAWLDAIRHAPALGFENSHYQPTVINLPDIYVTESHIPSNQNFPNYSSLPAPQRFPFQQQQHLQYSNMYQNKAIMSGMNYNCPIHGQGSMLPPYTSPYAARC